MAGFLLVATMCAVVGFTLANPTPMTIDPNFPPTWMGTCGEKEEDIAMFKEKMQTMQNCYENVFNSSTGLPKELPVDTNSSESEANPCKSLMSYVGCVDDFLSSLQYCFDEGHQNDMNTTIRATKAMFFEICQGLAKEELTASGPVSDAECMQEKEKNMFACFEDRAQETTLSEMLPNENMAVALLEMTYDENTCRTLHDVWHCVGDVFSTCPNNTITPIIQKGMYQFYESTQCNLMLVPQNPELTTTAFFFS